MMTDAHRIDVTLVTTRDHGDHTSTVHVAHDLAEGEAVEALVKRLLYGWDVYGEVMVPSFDDHIELRVAKPASDDWYGIQMQAVDDGE